MRGAQKSARGAGRRPQPLQAQPAWAKSDRPCRHRKDGADSHAKSHFTSRLRPACPPQHQSKPRESERTSSEVPVNPGPAVLLPSSRGCAQTADLQRVSHAETFKKPACARAPGGGGAAAGRRARGSWRSGLRCPPAWTGRRPQQPDPTGFRMPTRTGSLANLSEQARRPPAL